MVQETPGTSTRRDAWDVQSGTKGNVERRSRGLAADLYEVRPCVLPNLSPDWFIRPKESICPPHVFLGFAIPKKPARSF